MHNHRRNWIVMVVAALLAGFTQSAQACATCFGKSDSKLAEGMNMGILFLLFVVLFVLGAISAFFIYLAWRAAHHQPNVREVS